MWGKCIAFEFCLSKSWWKLDPITRQYYLRAKFIQEDTYRGDGFNLYAYCANNPVYYVDSGGYSGCPKVLYHYTNKKGMNGILESLKLNPSFKANNPKDVRYGDGQYLSDLRPDEYSPEQLVKKFINVPNKYKYTHCIEIDITGLNVIKGRYGAFVIPNNCPLDLTDRIVNSGKVGK